MQNKVYGLLSLIIALALAFGASSAARAAGNVYYVGTSGNDANPGTSVAPFKTFAKAVSVLTPGDTLQVMPGTYTESLRMTASGTATAPINVIGNGAVINMGGTQQTGIKISGSHIRLSGFEVTGATDAGIAMPGQFLTVTNNNVHHNVTQNGIGVCGTSTTGWSSAMKVGIGGQNITIENNTVYYNCGEGIAVTRGVGVVVKNNTVYDNFAPNIYIDNSPYSTVQGNLIYCTGAVLRRDGSLPTGIGLGEEFYEGWGAQLHDILVAGNTVRDCRKGIGAFASEVGGTFANVTITGNNIPSGEDRALTLSTSPNSNVVISYNILYNTPYISDSAGITLIGNTITGVNAPLCGRVADSSKGIFLSNDISDFPVPADYDGNGRVDIANFLPDNGTWKIPNLGEFSYGTTGDLPVVGDYNGDRIDEIAVFRASNSTWYLRGIGPFLYGTEGDIPVVADYNGDRKDDIAVFRPTNGTWYIRGIGQFQYGREGDIPVVADYNGDCKDEIAVFRPSNGTWYIRGIGQLLYGTEGDVPVVGDYNADGKDDIAVFRASNSTWYLRGIGPFLYGTEGDIPVVADYNADGKADIAVYRPSNNTWYIRGIGQFQ